MIKLGTRNSPLALKQASIIKHNLLQHHPNLAIDIVPIMTQGDKNKTQPLSEIGGKGVFIKTLEQALLEGTIDAAIHSLKDVTAAIDNKTILTSYLTPESRNDCFIFAHNTSYNTLDCLPQGMTLATSSLRRKAILNHLRPDIIIKDIRGNIGTRIEKINQGYADAVILSSVGLIRLNQTHLINYNCDPTQFIPAPGQGVITIQLLKNRQAELACFESINNPITKQQCLYEQRLIQQLGLDCNYPLGVYALLNDGIITLYVCWSRPDCSGYKTKILTGDHATILQAIDPLAKSIQLSIKG